MAQLARMNFTSEPEEEWMRGPFRKETEDSTAWLVRDKVPETHREVWEGERSSVNVGQERQLYHTIRIAKEQLCDKKGLYVEGGGREW